MAILSIQSHVTLGHVGNRAAVFALETLGHEVWPVNTVEYSAHPGHPGWRGQAVDPAGVEAVLDGLRRQGVLARAAAVITGYLGGVATGRLALAAALDVRRASPDALYLCDPVIGDDREGRYVADDLAQFIRDRAVPVADILTPNAFELAYLTGRPAATVAQALAAARVLVGRGARVVVATSIDAGGGAAAPGCRIATIAVTGGGAWRVTTPRLDTRAKGAGDLLAALFLGHYLGSGQAGQALARAVSSVYGLIARAGETGGGKPGLDLPLVAGRTEISGPATLFSAEPLD